MALKDFCKECVEETIPVYYPMLCAWCEAEGKHVRVGWSTVKHSHGICAQHQEMLKAEAVRLKAERASSLQPKGLSHVATDGSFL